MKFKRLNEKLIPVSEDIQIKFEEILSKNGWNIEGKGKTWMGNLHYQIIMPKAEIFADSDDEIFEQVRKFASPLITEIREFEEIYDIPVTWSFGPNKDNIVTAGIDLDKQFVED